MQESSPNARLLAALAYAFSYPERGIEETLTPLKALADEVEGTAGSTRLNSLFEASRCFANQTAEKLAYTRLFIGSLKMEAPPYASYYLSESHTLNGKAAAEVAATYHRFGLQLDDREKAPADHLRYMLHFLALLAARYEETGDDAFVETYQDFRDAYIAPWYGMFRSLVNKNAEEPYYPELASLIEDAL